MGLGPLHHGASTECRVRKLGSGLPVSRLGNPEDCSSSLGPGIFICKKRASEPFLSTPVVQVLHKCGKVISLLGCWLGVPCATRWESLADKSCEAPGAGLGPKQGFEKGQLSPLCSLGLLGDTQLPLPSAVLETPASERRAGL